MVTMKRIFSLALLALALAGGCRTAAVNDGPPDPSLFSPIPDNTNRVPSGAGAKAVTRSARQLELAWNAPADFTDGDYFEVWTSPDLVHWNFTWGPEGTNVVIEPSQPCCFYRVRRCRRNGAGVEASDWATVTP